MESGRLKQEHAETYFKGACEPAPSPFARGTSPPSPAPGGGDYMSLFGSGLKDSLAGRQLAPAQARMRADPSGPHF